MVIPSLAWMTDMTLPGYLIAAVAYAALFGLAVTIVPGTAPGRWLALPGAIEVAVPYRRPDGSYRFAQPLKYRIVAV